MPVRSGAQPHTPQQLQHQRESAREALDCCARRCGLWTHGWSKDAANVPLPREGVYWSVTHKRDWSAAVVSDRPVGIDIEHCLPRNEALLDAVALPGEWRILGDQDWPGFFRLWTAKEATLKANRVGIGELSACRLVHLLNDRRMVLEFRGRRWRIEHFHHANHVVAVTCGANAVEWHVGNSSHARPARSM